MRRRFSVRGSMVSALFVPFVAVVPIAFVVVMSAAVTGGMRGRG